MSENKSELFDDISRIVGSQIPRRRALKLIMSVLAGGALGNVVLKASEAQVPSSCSQLNCALPGAQQCRPPFGCCCPAFQPCCPSTGGNFECCPARWSCSRCIPSLKRICCPPNHGCSVCPDGGTTICCPDKHACSECPDGETIMCCPAGTVCAD